MAIAPQSHPQPASHNLAIDYASPASRPSRYMFSTIACVALLIPTIMLTVLLGPLAVRFEFFFKDYGVWLPPLSQWLLYAGWLFRHRHLWMVVWLAPITLPFLIAPLLGHDPRRRLIFARVAMALSFVFTVAMLILAIFALFLPVTNLINAMSGK